MMSYDFRIVELCNMCGAGSHRHKVIGKRLNASQGKNPSIKKGVSVSILKCLECGLIFSNPQPVPTSIQDHYGVPPEEYWKESYFQLDDYYFSSQIKIFEEKTETDGRVALDIGAGLGKCMIALNRAGFKSYGFEPSIPFFEKAISKMGIDKEYLKLASIEEVQYPSGFFDFITFGAVLEHLYDPDVAIKKALTWLKPGGLIHIEVPSSNWLISNIVNTYYRFIGTDYVTNLSPMHAPFHLFEFSINSFIKNSKRNNYSIAFSEYYVCRTFMPKVVQKFVIPYMRYTDTGMQLSVWLRKI